MKDRRGALGRATELAESVVAGVRRRQQARVPKVLLYDGQGLPRTLDPGSDAAERILATADAMILLIVPADADAGKLETGDPVDGQGA